MATLDTRVLFYRGWQKETAVPATTTFAGDLVEVLRLEVECQATEPVSFVASSAHALILTRAGICACHSANSKGRQRIAAPGNLTFVPMGSTVRGLFAKGVHTMDVLTWPTDAVPPLERFLLAWRSTPQAASFLTAHHSHVLREAFDWLDEACKTSGPQADFALLALVLKTVPALTAIRGRVAIAPTPTDMSETVRELVEQVRADPSKSWSLTKASDLAGYSSFHFSRIFKQMVGCGFHEFVDRCRTEAAVESLTGTLKPLADVSNEAGFPSLRAMRESIKDYLGLSVSDLRGLVGNSS